MRRKVMTVVAFGALAAGIGIVSGVGTAGAGSAVGTVDMTIHKTVVGTDPGVAFPITLNCHSEGLVEAPAVPDITVPNNGGDSIVVNLKNGETKVVVVGLPRLEPQLMTCEVTEDLAGVTLPAGITCTPSVVPESFVVYDASEQQPQVRPGEFTVTNTCSAEVQAIEAQANTTG